MKKKINIFFIITIIFIMLNIFSINTSLAAATTTINPEFYNPSTNVITTDDAVEVVGKVGVVLGAVRNISAVVAVIMLMVMGLKYIIGSAEEKANYKASMWPYIIGCILAVAGTTIVSFIYNAIK